MSFEAKCPECNRTYPGLDGMLDFQRRTSDNPFEDFEPSQDTGARPSYVVVHSMSPVSDNRGNGAA